MRPITGTESKHFDLVNLRPFLLGSCLHYKNTKATIMYEGDSMATRDESEPMWGDSPEYRAFSEARHGQDPHYTTLVELVKPELERARDFGPQTYVAYLNRLSGLATFAVRGMVHIPRRTRAFGDWLLLPNSRHPDIIDSEAVDTQDAFPYGKGKSAYKLRRATSEQNGRVMVVAERWVEDGEPAVLYPNELERFDLYHVSEKDSLDERDRKHFEGTLRFLGLVDKEGPGLV